MQVQTRQQGVTLIELLVAMIVIGIGLALMIPAVSVIGATGKLDVQSREIQNALAYARSEAIRLNTNVLFCHTSNGQVCSAPGDDGWQGWLVRAAGAAVGAETGPVLRTGTLVDPQLVVTSGAVLQGAQHALRFNPQGLIRAFGANTPLSDQIRICIPVSVNPNIYLVNFNSGGRLRVTTANGDGSCV